MGERIQYWQYDNPREIEEEFGIPASDLNLPARLRERPRIFPVKDVHYSAVRRDPPPPWGGKPCAMWGLLRSSFGRCDRLAGKAQEIRIDALAELAAYYYVLDATGQKISKSVAKKIAVDMDFDYRSMHKEEMIELYTRHAEFDFG